MDVEKKTVNEDGIIFIDMDNSSANPCLTCGACCYYFRISFYQGEVLSGWPPESLVETVGRHFACMQGTLHGGRCIALEGTVGQSIACKIYSERPICCREYPVWDDDGIVNKRCNKARAKHNLNPLPKTKEEWLSK
jgi:Fe-S-cluster containining protein